MSLLFFPVRKGMTLEAVQAESDVEVSEIPPEDYFVRILDEVSTILGPITVLGICNSVSRDRRGKVEDSVVSYFRKELGGLLVPRPLRRVIRAAGQDGDRDLFLSYLDNYAMDILDPSVDLADASERRRFTRALLLSLGADGVLTDRQVAVCELALDLFLLQKAATLDLADAEAGRSPGKTRGEWIEDHVRSGSRLAYLDTVDELRRGSRGSDVTLDPSAEEWLLLREPIWISGLLG